MKLLRAQIDARLETEAAADNIDSVPEPEGYDGALDENFDGRLEADELEEADQYELVETNETDATNNKSLEAAVPKEKETE